MKTCLKESKYSYFAVLAANIISFITGTSIAWSSPILSILEDDNISKNPLNRKINDEEESWISSLSAMGGIFGPFIFANVVPILGRKITITFITIPFLTAYLLAAFAENVIYYYCSRFLMGIGVGGMFCIIPIYVVETAENTNRGLLQATTTSSIMLGILFSYCVGPYVSIKIFNLILSGICVIFVPVFWLIAPETPYYLVSVNKNKEAFQALKYLRRRSKNEIQKELDEITAHLKDLKPGSYSDLFNTRGRRKAFFYSVALITFQQLSGLTVILYFAENIFKASGSEIPAEISAIIIGSVQFLVSTISPPFLEIVGRKILLLVAITGAVISEILLGIYFYLQKNNYDVSDINWLPVFSLVMFISFYNFGMGSVPWSLLGEILPLNIIAKAAMLATSVHWFVGFFLTKYFGALTQSIGMAGSFWFFAGFCILFDVFVYFFIFETKGKSLAEIQAILNR